MDSSRLHHTKNTSSTAGMKCIAVKAVVYIPEDMRVMEKSTCTCLTRFDATNAHHAFKPQEVKTCQRGLALAVRCCCYGRDAKSNSFKECNKVFEIFNSQLFQITQKKYKAVIQIFQFFHVLCSLLHKAQQYFLN